jgi:FixJ family two-component response regulator
VQRDIYLNPFIILLSGESDVECIERAMQSGANKFMEKPSPFKDIQAAI